MGKLHAQTVRLIEAMREILQSRNPQTVRQCYYQLVSRQVVQNSRGAYQTVSDALVKARQDGAIPWEWVEDRLRRPRKVPMWDDVPDFADNVLPQYRRDVWAAQPGLIEAWLEKDALSGIFEEVLQEYGITLNVGRGFDGWDSIHNAAERYGDGEAVTVLYFGDFDPSGEAMVTSLRERLAFFDCRPSIIKIALTAEDIDRYHLPPNFTKASDSRRDAFVALHGDVAVELDALRVDVLEARLRDEIEARMDLSVLAAVRKQEQAERKRMALALRDVGGVA
jgi:hypothetical protein